MSHFHDYYRRVPPAPEVSWGPQPRDATAGSVVLGWIGGRAMEYSDERGQAAPPSHVSTAGKVLEYEPFELDHDLADEGLNLGAFILADFADKDGAAVDFGPLFEPDLEMDLDKWWPNSDWSVGLTVHVVDSSASGSGAAGQFGVLAGRDRTDPYKFRLRHAFKAAPAPGDLFEIGALVWIVLPTIASAPFSGLVQVGNGELLLKRISGDQGGGIEIITSGNAFELRNPSYPFQEGTLLAMEYDRAALEEPLARYSWAAVDASGGGNASREVAVSFRDIIRGGRDYKIDSVAYFGRLTDIAKRPG